MANKCIECDKYIEQDVYSYSAKVFGAPLCRLHQNWIKNSGATEEAVELFFALRMMGVPAKLEKFDGNKTIDIAIPECKVNIEVDGKHHHYNADQALSDLQRTYYSFLKGYLTLRIPNSLVKTHLNDTVNYITNLINEKNRKGWKRYSGY